MIIIQNYSIELLDTLKGTDMVTPTEKLKSMPILLTGVALNYYTNNLDKFTTYKAVFSTLRHYESVTKNDKNARLITKWQSIFLKQPMYEEKSESKVTVFRSFVTKLIFLQNQLNVWCDTDKLLRDRLLNTVNILSIKVTLWEHMKRTSQKAENCVANHLSDKSISAGIVSSCAISKEEYVVFY